MKTLFALGLLALPLCGQQVIGLPQCGVDLVGTLEEPMLVNHSGKDVLTANLKFTNDLGDGPVATEYFFESPSDILHNGGFVVTHGMWPATGPDISRPKATLQLSTDLPRVNRVFLDGVALQDGEYCGPDKYGTFREISHDFQIMAKFAAEFLTNKDWVRLQHFVNDTSGFHEDPEESTRWHAARAIYNVWFTTQSDQKGLEFVQYLAKLPILHKTLSMMQRLGQLALSYLPKREITAHAQTFRATIPPMSSDAELVKAGA